VGEKIKTKTVTTGTHELKFIVYHFLIDLR